MGFLEADPRWIRLNQTSWLCPCCGVPHDGLPDLGCDKPDYWPGKDPPQENSAVVPKIANILTRDFCILDDEHYFIRCVLNLPIIGGDVREFGLGVWSSLSKANFETYVETFDDREQGRLGPWFGWLSNSLKGYPATAALQCQVHPRDKGHRPTLTIGPADGTHPLAVQQREGITFDQILDLLALNEHDIRPALLQV